eukprot:TRINITY_DN8424_c0_g1_i5.p1 TRINITY_DN8424_c0_g1~~TRINITY_DN8424_c0_g1_i5.p1  ORF type:complete len:189 (-),score=21.13 TRINITY_DN8424_c0_g1_i5:300-866(-)
MTSGPKALILSCVCLLAFSSCFIQTEAAARNGTLELTFMIRGLQKYKTYTSFIALLAESGIVPSVRNFLSTTQTGATLLVPTNAAILALPVATRAALVKNKKLLQSVLLKHIISREWIAAKIVSAPVGQGFPTLQGLLLQKFPNTGKYISIGPKGAQKASQLAQIVQGNIYVDTVAAVHGINRVLGYP